MSTDRITARHLQRAAIVYVRQSSPEQVRNHAESTRIQIGLRDKAVAFGWPNPVTIVDDLGISAGGFAHRAGFQHMAAEVSLGQIGIILCFEASVSRATPKTGPSCSRSAGTLIRSSPISIRSMIWPCPMIG